MKLEFEEIFQSGLGAIKGRKTKLNLRKGRLQNFTRPEEYPTQYDQQSTRNCRNQRTKESLRKSIGASGHLRSLQYPRQMD